MTYRESNDHVIEIQHGDRRGGGLSLFLLVSSMFFFCSYRFLSGYTVQLKTTQRNVITE